MKGPDAPVNILVQGTLTLMSLFSAVPVLRFLAAAFAVLAGLFFAAPAQAEKYAAIVVDADTREVLHAANADELRYPASLTKVMTLYLLFDALDEGEVTLDTKLPVSAFAARQAPSNLRLKAGSTITVSNAIRALVSKSANDVAVVVAEKLGGSEKAFARSMTDKARALGMEKTVFRNASGLPDLQQVTTARDLALLSTALLEHHAHNYHHFSERSFTWGQRTYRNHNELLGRVFGVDGIKTGYTRASGFNLIASAERSNRRVIAIMFGGNSSKSRDQHVTDLLEAAFTTLGVNGTPEASALSFASVRVPVDPNDAAQPMLNGKPFAMVAEGDVTSPEYDGGTEEDPLGLYETESSGSDIATSTFVAPPAAAMSSQLSVSEYERQQLSN
jgi:D-alanyl-D-alanine carboxypeptidase